MKAIKVIYDESKAIQKKKEADDALPKANREARIHNAIWTIPTILLGVLITILWVWALTDSNLDINLNFTPFLLSCLLVPIFYALISWAVFSVKLDPIYEPGENYPALVLYYQAIEGKTVLDYEFHSYQYDYELTAVLENEEHVVSRYTLPTRFPAVTRTDVPEITFDLENQVAYVPYCQQNQSN